MGFEVPSTMSLILLKGIMKKCKHVTGWTDYPFEELGDTPGKAAPIRHVNVLSYDGDKYVKISFEKHGDISEIKRGYLYRSRGRLGQVKTVSMRKLERMLK